LIGIHSIPRDFNLPRSHPCLRESSKFCEKEQAVLSNALRSIETGMINRRDTAAIIRETEISAVSDPVCDWATKAPVPPTILKEDMWV
jgi:hypothetical protein